MPDLLETDIKFLQGVGPKRAELLRKELNIRTFRDLLYFFPYKYTDRTRFYSVKELKPSMPHVQIRGKITRLYTTGHKRKKRLVADFSDDTGTIELVWFRGVNWIRDTLRADVEYIAFGKPSMYGKQISIAHPELEETGKLEKEITASLQPSYSTTEELKNNYVTSKVIFRLIGNFFRNHRLNLEETMPEHILKRYKLPGINESLRTIHLPESASSLAKAEYRLKLEELFYIQLKILSQKYKRDQHSQGFVFSRVGDYLNNFYKTNLPFALTGAQKRVMKEIRKNIGSGKQMNRLLQGDVGSGKTLVALMTMLIALDNGFQTCLMAPTEILAGQHFQTIDRLIRGLDIECHLLTGSTGKSDRKTIHQKLQDGRLQILVGTHAVIEDEVNFHKLGLIIIDEQHRFGVAQRAKLWKKNINPPHVLVMTATPIPRTLAMTLYGDLEVSVIDEMPPGRKPVQTFHANDSKRLRVFGFLKKQIKMGRQIYVVYPLIKESEKMDYKDLEDGYFSFKQAFPDCAISIVHGRMKAEDKEIAMKHFIAGRTDIMVATTVIEVGVDIPNATVMVIESAERFGLSQLHQLRGRVGRGTGQSYCILMTSHKLSEEARKRIEVITGTNDGFEIAEMDLKLRGPGDIEGTQQSGMPFDLKIANLGKDGRILQTARNLAIDILEDDPGLVKGKNQFLVKNLKKFRSGDYDWSSIS